MTNLSLGKEIGREADPPRTFTPKKMENDQMLFVTIYFFNCVFPIQGRWDPLLVTQVFKEASFLKH